MLITFAANNSQPVTVNVYGGSVGTYPLWGLIIVPFFTGIIAGNLLDVVRRVRISRENRRLRRDLARLQQQSFSGTHQ